MRTCQSLLVVDYEALALFGGGRQMPYTEANYENAVIEVFTGSLGYNYVYGPAVARDYSDPLYTAELLPALRRINPHLPEAAITEAVYKLRNIESGDLLSKNKRHRDEMAKRFKDEGDTLKIAIVVDMWLTGFDVPSLATMYVYKPMSGHNLMQAIARVNRVYQDKEGSLVVDYVGIASALKQAMNDYTNRDKSNYGDTDITKTALPSKNWKSAATCSTASTTPLL
jgi:type I site-specific restriction-modification system R (restriction) subunit